MGTVGQLNVKTGPGTGPGTVLGTKGTNGYISWISKTKECLESEFRSNLPDLPLVVFFSTLINLACEVLLFVRLSQDELAQGEGGAGWGGGAII